MWARIRRSVAMARAISGGLGGWRGETFCSGAGACSGSPRALLLTAMLGAMGALAISTSPQSGQAISPASTWLS